MKTKAKLLILLIMVVGMITLPIGEVKAGLQANPNTHYKKTDKLGKWITEFRKMEITGGAMGLKEEFNTDWTAKSESNGIDVHMMRTTEYGAIAILSASGYGNPSNAKNITSTTGNKTGVMLNTTKYELTAGGSDSPPAGANTIYYDTYMTSNASAKRGDALGNASTANPGCAGWHSASDSHWVSENRYFRRGGGGIFSFYESFDAGGSYAGRGVAVCGAEL